jgi:hypothetical protein
VFPFAIINSFGSRIEKRFRKFAERLRKEIGFSVGAGFKPAPMEKGIRMDAKTPLEILQDLKNKYGEWIDQDVLEAEINSNLEILDAWAVDGLNKTLEKQREVLRSQGVSEAELDRRVPLIPKTDPARQSAIPKTAKKNLLLQNQAYAEHFAKVEDIITDGILSGKKTDEITEAILKATDMDANRARFWAEDQAAIFQAEQKRIAAIRGGYTHYRWKKGGANSRASHAIHDRKIYSWNVGVNNLTRPGARHPGEDYRCHCDAELLTTEQALKLGGTIQPPRTPQPTAGLVENYYGSEEEKAIKGANSFSFLDGLIGNLSQPYKVSVMTATKEMNQVIDMEKIYSEYPIQVQSFPEESIYTNKAGGAYANSNIFINEKSSNAVLTVIHETAHHLEEKVLAKGVSFLNTVEGQGFLSEIKKMDSYKNLLNSKNMPREISAYYSKDKEVFSRIMEQYFAKKRGGIIQKRFLEKQEYLAGKHGESFYFSKSEFSKIEKIVDFMFKEKGLMR